MPKLVIYVECEDASDLDWLRQRCLGAVEDKVEEAREDNRLDGHVEVNWDIED